MTVHEVTAAPAPRATISSLFPGGSTGLDRVVEVVILVNTIALIGLGFSDEGSTTAKVWLAVDLACVAFFLAEVALKLRRQGTRGYFARWGNRFDFAVTMISAPALLHFWMDLPEMGAFLALRIARLLRLLRNLHFIPNREHLIAGVGRAMRASVGVFLALLIVNLILALGATFLFGKAAPEYFGNPLLSIYSLFKVFTVEGWYEIPDLLADRAGDQALAVFSRVYFVVCVVVGGILGLSLLNAVFIDEMTADNADDLERKLDAVRDELRALRAELAASRPAAAAPADGEQLADPPAADAASTGGVTSRET